MPPPTPPTTTPLQAAQQVLQQAAAQLGLPGLRLKQDVLAAKWRLAGEALLDSDSAWPQLARVTVATLPVWLLITAVAFNGWGPSPAAYVPSDGIGWLVWPLALAWHLRERQTRRAQQLAEQLLAIGQAAPGYTAVLNGRFKGGHITRQYGNPAQGIHAVQLEMTQCSYMQESWPFEYLPEVAVGVQPHVRRMLEAVLAFVEGPQIKT